MYRKMPYGIFPDATLEASDYIFFLFFIIFDFCHEKMKNAKCMSVKICTPSIVRKGMEKGLLLENTNGRSYMDSKVYILLEPLKA